MWNLHFANRTKAECVWTFGKSHPVCDFYCLTVGNRVLDQTKTTCKQQLHTKICFNKVYNPQCEKRILISLRFYVKSIFSSFRISKSAILNILAAKCLIILPHLTYHKRLLSISVYYRTFLISVRENVRLFPFWDDTTVGETRSTYNWGKRRRGINFTKLEKSQPTIVKVDVASFWWV